MTNPQLDEAVQRLNSLVNDSDKNGNSADLDKETANDIRTVLAALDEARKLSEWQPIQTAPCGKTLMLYQPASTGRSPLSERVIVDRWPIASFRDATHWMHVPASPAIASSSDGKTKDAK